MKTWWAKKDKKPKEAFQAGLALIEGGFLNYQCNEVLAKLDEWGKDPKEHGLGKKDVQQWEKLSEFYKKGRADGFREYESTNRKAKL